MNLLSKLSALSNLYENQLPDHAVPARGSTEHGREGEQVGAEGIGDEWLV
jgi:hypothetical protein